MEIAIISGKGGTGKSSISAAFATIDKNILIADCDVDAANLYLIFEPTIEHEQIYTSSQKAKINYNLCTNCALCIDFCSFDAIKLINKKVVIQEYFCDGCKLCYRICPQKAISMVDENESRLYSGSYRNGKMVYGRLAPGEENSGRLVSLVREKAKSIALKNNIKTIIIDGAPGIACPVISAITGVDKTIIITEPTLSGLNDLKRTIDIVNKFNLKFGVIINKYDLNINITNKIIKYCEENNINFVGKIEFNKNFVKAMIECKTIIEYKPYSELTKNIKNMWKKILYSE